MTFVDKLIVLCIGWAVLLGVFNPFFESARLRNVCLALLIVASVLWVVK